MVNSVSQSFGATYIVYTYHQVIYRRRAHSGFNDRWCENDGKCQSGISSDSRRRSKPVGVGGWGWNLIRHKVKMLSVDLEGSDITFPIEWISGARFNMQIGSRRHHKGSLTWWNACDMNHQKWRHVPFIPELRSRDDSGDLMQLNVHITSREFTASALCLSHWDNFALIAHIPNESRDSPPETPPLDFTWFSVIKPWFCA